MSGFSVTTSTTVLPVVYLSLRSARKGSKNGYSLVEGKTERTDAGLRVGDEETLLIILAEICDELEETIEMEAEDSDSGKLIMRLRDFAIRKEILEISKMTSNLSKRKKNLY